jgi:hypothetical protein
MIFLGHLRLLYNQHLKQNNEKIMQQQMNVVAWKNGLYHHLVVSTLHINVASETLVDKFLKGQVVQRIWSSLGLPLQSKIKSNFSIKYTNI